MPFFPSKFTTCERDTGRSVNCQHWGRKGEVDDCRSVQNRLFFFFFCHTHGMWKFLGQGLNPCHSSDPSCCSDNVRSITRAATGELQNRLLNTMEGSNFHRGRICFRLEDNFLFSFVSVNVIIKVTTDLKEWEVVQPICLFWVISSIKVNKTFPYVWYLGSFKNQRKQLEVQVTWK